MARGDALNRVVAALAAQGRHLNREGRSSCPAHVGDDDNLSVKQGDRGVLLKCFSYDCSANDIAASLGLRIEELFDDYGEGSSGGAYCAPVIPTAPETPVAIARVRPEDAPPMSGGSDRFAALYNYTDADGYLTFRQTRAAIPPPGKKGILPFHLDADYKWQSGYPDGVERVPYALPEMLDAIRAGEIVLFVEGEKDVDNARKHLGVAATTFAFGAKTKVDPNLAKWFVGADVVLCGDNDDTGRAFMQAVGNALHGHARSVRQIELPDLPEKGDISDWIVAGGTTEALDEMLASAPAFVPTPQEILQPNGETNALRERRGPRTLAEWRTDTTLLTPPASVVPFLAWTGRITLLSAREKAGKSTLTAQGVAALTRGAPFLGQEPPARATVLWYAIDEPLGDTVRRFSAYDADEHRLYIVDEKPTPTELSQHIALTGAQVVVIDTLAELAAGSLDSDRDANAVARFIRPYTVAVRESGAALVLLHHTTKIGREYRGSVQLGAAVDVILTMWQAGAKAAKPGEDLDEEPQPDDGRRILHGKGRGGVTVDLRLSFDGARYTLGDAPLPLRVRILRVLLDGEAASEEIAGLLRVRKNSVQHELRALKSGGYVTGEHRLPARITESGRLLALGELVRPGNQQGTAAPSHEGAEAVAAEPSGHRLMVDGNRSGTVAVEGSTSAVPERVTVHLHGNRNDASREGKAA